MNKNIGLCLISLILTLQFSAFAQSTQTATELTEVDSMVSMPSPEKKKKSRVSSAENREKLNFGFAGQLIGLDSHIFGMSTALQGYYFMTPSSVLQIDVFSNGYSDDDNAFLESDNYKASGAAVSLKRFLGNSFYLSAGLRHENIRLYNRERTYPLFSSNYNEYSWEAKGSRSSVIVHMGNQWQWKNFTLGADWIGVGLPFANTAKYEISSLVNESLESAERDYNNRHKKYFSGTYAYAVRFYLGFSF